MMNGFIIAMGRDMKSKRVYFAVVVIAIWGWSACRTQPNSSTVLDSGGGGSEDGRDIKTGLVQISESDVREWVERDFQRLQEESPDAAEYVRYVTLHNLYNSDLPAKDMDLARLGMSKVLNCSARHAPKIANPEPIDRWATVYRFDLRDYFAWDLQSNGGGYELVRDNGQVLEKWRIAMGNTNSRVVSATQLVNGFRASGVRYNEIMEIPGQANQLERQVGVDNSRGLESYHYAAVDDAITHNSRLIWTPKNIDDSLEQAIVKKGGKPGLHYWRGVDIRRRDPFDYYRRPVPNFFGRDFSHIQARGSQNGGSAAEIIFGLPNGCQGYMIAGFANQRRNDALRDIVVDPNDGARNGGRLLNGVSCESCHMYGLQTTHDDMREHLEENRNQYRARTYQTALELYPGTDVIREKVTQDRDRFMNAMAEMAEVGTTTTNVRKIMQNREPVQFLFKRVRRLDRSARRGSGGGGGRNGGLGGLFGGLFGGFF